MQHTEIKGYTDQSTENKALVNKFKIVEERILREIDAMEKSNKYNPRWLAIGRTQLEQAFMAINRSVFNPKRVELED